MTNQEKTEKLLHLMDVLCDVNFTKNVHDMDSWVSNLNEIYTSEYRHAYSEIFFKLQQIASQNHNPEILEILGENLNVLGKRIDELMSNNTDTDYRNVEFGYRKFADHIRLEIGRYNFIKSNFLCKQVDEEIDPVSEKTSAETTSKLLELETAINNMRPTVTKTQKAVERADYLLSGLDEKLENNKISSITTLTIFSAVILAFSGGITFEAGIFNGMANSTPYRLVFTIGLTGFILFNTIFALLYLVGKMAGKKISSKCKYLSFENSRHINRVCGDGYCTKGCSEVTFSCKMLHKYSYVFAINIFIIYILYSDFFLWLGDGEIISIAFLLSQVSVAVVLIMTVVSSLVSKRMRFNRIKLHYKVAILQKIAEPKEEDSMIADIGNLLASAFGADVNKLDRFLETLNVKNDKEILRSIDQFVDEYLLDENRLAISVSKYENRVNKRKWRALKKNL